MNNNYEGFPENFNPLEYPKCNSAHFERPAKTVDLAIGQISRNWEIWFDVIDHQYDHHFESDWVCSECGEVIDYELTHYNNRIMLKNDTFNIYPTDSEKLEYKRNGDNRAESATISKPNIELQEILNVI